MYEIEEIRSNTLISFQISWQHSWKIKDSASKILKKIISILEFYTQPNYSSLRLK